jgi:hypothetical protein
MSEAVSNFEGLLREALAPVDPPEDLVVRLESTLQSLAEIAAEELEAWELKAMRDPRNWARPAAAVLLGGTAGVALVILRARHRPRPDSGLLRARRGAGRTLREIDTQARKLLGER